MTACAVTYSSLGNRCDRRRGHEGPHGGNLTPAGREVLLPELGYLCGREILSWAPADTVDGPGVELLLTGGRRLRVDGVGLWAIALLGMVGIFKLPAEREDEQ